MLQNYENITCIVQSNNKYICVLKHLYSSSYEFYNEMSLRSLIFIAS
jgi:hypothetical protein